MLMISQECDQTSADISIEDNRQAIAAKVLNSLEQPKKQSKVDEDGHAIVTSKVEESMLVHGSVDQSF